jgi:hypothetical protein
MAPWAPGRQPSIEPDDIGKGDAGFSLHRRCGLLGAAAAAPSIFASTSRCARVMFDRGQRLALIALRRVCRIMSQSVAVRLACQEAARRRG